jgi:hypothetical protein
MDFVVTYDLHAVHDTDSPFFLLFYRGLRPPSFALAVSYVPVSLLPGPRRRPPSFDWQSLLYKGNVGARSDHNLQNSNANAIKHPPKPIISSDPLTLLLSKDYAFPLGLTGIVPRTLGRAA